MKNKKKDRIIYSNSVQHGRNVIECKLLQFRFVSSIDENMQSHWEVCDRVCILVHMMKINRNMQKEERKNALQWVRPIDSWHLKSENVNERSKIKKKNKPQRQTIHWIQTIIVSHMFLYIINAVTHISNQSYYAKWTSFIASCMQ